MYYTVGYEGKTVNEFVGLLLGVKCKTLYDIRTFPNRKKFGFGSSELQNTLEQNGIGYKWEPKLGGKIKHPDAVRLKFIPPPAAGNVVFMCFERSIGNCHRKQIADLVFQKHGVMPIELNQCRISAPPVMTRELFA
jgi:uncharacterized protein (DUF488 family)